MLKVNHSGDSHVRLTALLAAGYHPQREPYVRLLLQTFRASQLLDLRKRTRILVPKGRVLMGCLDEEKKLSYGEIFLQVTPAAGNRKRVDDGLSSFQNYPITLKDNGMVAHVVTGWVVVAKNPCLHPGDIRRLKAVDVPGLRHMVDCLVFPQHGHRWNHDRFFAAFICSASNSVAHILFFLQHDCRFEYVWKQVGKSRNVWCNL